MSDDLAGRDFWEHNYVAAEQDTTAALAPGCYHDRAFEAGFLRFLGSRRPQSMLEVGCGDSRWLPYLGGRLGIASLAGIDYSATGCDLARQRLHSAKMHGEVFCADLFDLDLETVGRYDLVYSIGVVEHFDDTTGVVGRMAELVAPGGMLLTSVPNLHRSMHWPLLRLLQPGLAARHKPLGRRVLERAHREAGLGQLRSGFVGWFSLQIIAWNKVERFRSLVPLLFKLNQRLSHRLDHPLTTLGYGGIAPLAPFLMVAGSRVQAD